VTTFNFKTLTQRVEEIEKKLKYIDNVVSKWEEEERVAKEEKALRDNSLFKGVKE